ncbi:MAG: hypothetical protein IJY94_05195 [Clostridia bacterium]|nr:hypothetical protein [Clostridia bacterium]
MKIYKKFLSAVMAFCMLLGTLSVLSALPVFAAEETETSKEPINAVDFFNVSFKSKEEKVASMDLMAERFEYKLYSEPLTGEVAIVNTKTGDILMTNPYGVGNFKAADSVKKTLLSQVIINFQSVDGIITARDMTSFESAAELKQIKVKPIKNGVRVEYVIGKQETRYIFPDQIEKKRFEEEILSKIPYDEETYDAKTATYEEKQARLHYMKLKGAYALKDPSEDLPDAIIAAMYAQYPILDKNSEIGKNSPVEALYVFNTKANMKLKNEIEFIIKQYCPNYTFEDRQADHELCQYEEKSENPVQFRVALEYYIDETGLRVRIPANGIRYDQSSYQLNKMTCLPYMGAADSNNTGYTVFPDGSGTLTRFEDVKESGQSFSFFAIPYGQDYVYRTMKIGKNLMPMRMPVFGLVEDTQYTTTDEATGESSTYIRKSGYFAIIEEGDALAMVRAKHGEKGHNYYSIQIELDPRPKDTYSLSSIVSVGGNGSFTAVSERRYTGNFTIRYIMLSDLEYGAKNGIDTTGCYDTSYMGMAFAYRQRLLDTGAMTGELLEAGDIPLYLEMLGAMNVQEKFLSIPVTVKKALTTFNDVKKMHSELGENGINNLVFKLTGFMNGGLKSTLANQIDVEKVVGGNSGLKKLQKYANKKNFEIYLDADFSYTYKDTLFDGFNRRKEAVRAIDDRFVQKQEYDAVLQKFTSTGMLVIAPSSFEDIFGKLNKDAKKLKLEGLALASLGSDLSSDFDEDEPYNRENSKQQVIDTLEKVRKAGYDIMMDGGNAYAVGYAKHILNIPLVSSRRAQASEAIPFFAIVYHGYLNYAGSPTNMAGDMRYEMLKILENGASPYFLLVYRNSEKLKEDKTLSKYFAISYKNWKEDIIETYTDLNKALSPVKNSPIADHGFLTGMRIPTAAELEADRLDKEQADKEQADKEQADREDAEREDALKDHLGDNYIENDTETGTPEEIAPNETVSKYLVDNGMIVKVTYENGYSFILNYNYFDVTVEELGDTVVPKLGYVVLNANGEIVINSGEEAAA